MNAKEHLLECLSEECAEVSQRVSKALRFGLDEIQTGQELTNAARIAQELNDLRAVADMLQQLGIIPIDGTSFSVKRAKVEKYMEYSRKLGALNPTYENEN